MSMSFAPSAEGTAGLGGYVDRSHLPGLVFNGYLQPPRICAAKLVLAVAQLWCELSS